MTLPLIALLAFSDSPVVYRAVWYSVRPLVPFTVLAGVLLLIRAKGLSGLRRQQIMLLLSLAGMCSLVQFPFAAPVYFLYVTPLLVLAIVAFFSDQTAWPRMLIAATLGFYFLFALLRVNPGFIYQMGFGYARDNQTELLGPGAWRDPGEPRGQAAVRAAGRDAAPPCFRRFHVCDAGLSRSLFPHGPAQSDPHNI